MVFKSMVATCFAKGGRLEQSYRPLREESARDVWDAITTYSATEPVDFIQHSGGMVMLLRKIWNGFCEWIGQTAWTWVNEHVKEMLVRLGFKTEEAVVIAEDF
ncbi:unnamed protein product [Rotaria sordida]|uniref:Uncharacterized protein n=1 Tax=Rotaria sordida TaxID=392033 RepID=A0A815KEK2_9BILA|nr:unnamed protein product [Rotaria sordida]CAF4189349.1 unnamed protein product [Rotaria sordida]